MKRVKKTGCNDEVSEMNLSQKVLSYILYFFISINVLLCIVYYIICLETETIVDSGGLILAGILLGGGSIINGVYWLLRRGLNWIQRALLKNDMEVLCNLPDNERTIVNVAGCIVFIIICYSLRKEGQVYWTLIMSIIAIFLGRIGWLNNSLYDIFECVYDIFVQWLTLFFVVPVIGEVILICCYSERIVLKVNIVIGILTICAVIINMKVQQVHSKKKKQCTVDKDASVDEKITSEKIINTYDSNKTILDEKQEKLVAGIQIMIIIVVLAHKIHKDFKK